MQPKDCLIISNMIFCFICAEQHCDGESKIIHVISKNTHGAFTGAVYGHLKTLIEHAFIEQKLQYCFQN